MESDQKPNQDEDKFYEPVFTWVCLTGAYVFGIVRGLLEGSYLGSNYWYKAGIGAIAALGTIWLLNRFIRPASWWRSAKIAQVLEATFVFSAMFGFIALAVFAVVQFLQR